MCRGPGGCVSLVTQPTSRHAASVLACGVPCGALCANRCSPSPSVTLRDKLGRGEGRIIDRMPRPSWLLLGFLFLQALAVLG